VRVAILAESFNPNKGYPEYYLARELARLNNDVKIFTFQRRTEISRSKVDGFRVVRIPSLLDIHSYHLFSVRNASSIIEITKEYPPEIVHSQPLVSPVSLLFMTFDRAFNYKVVGSLITGESSISNVFARLEFDFVRLLIKKYVDRKAEIIFALSEDVKKLLLDFFHISPKKIFVVPFGADHNLFRFNSTTRQRIRESLGLHHHDLAIVYSGKIVPAKRPDLLIKALAHLKSIDKPIKLLIVGDGSFGYVESLKKLALSLNIGNKIVFHHAVHRTKLPEYYSASDIAVWPGAPSISIIEAMSTGLPVIVRKSFVSRCELQYDNGFSFDPGNLNALTTCLRKLISDPELRVRMGKRSRALVEDKLNWEKIAKTYLDLYKMVRSPKVIENNS